jgi:hypothetical protein
MTTQEIFRDLSDSEFKVYYFIKMYKDEHGEDSLLQNMLRQSSINQTEVFTEHMQG